MLRHLPTNLRYLSKHWLPNVILSFLKASFHIWLNENHFKYDILARGDFITNIANSVQFSSVAQPCPTLCDPMNHSTPGLPVHHQLPESTQTHVHWVGNAIQPSKSSVVPFSSCPQFLPGIFQWVSSSHQMAKVLELQLQHQSFQWTPRIDFL